MYDKIYGVIQSVDDFVWGWGMIVLLLGTHIFMTIRTGFIQRKTITKGIPLSVAAGVNHRYGKYHRRGYGHRAGRTGRGALVLADRRIRHGDKICGVSGRGQIPCEDG